MSSNEVRRKINIAEIKENIGKIVFATKKMFGFAFSVSKWHTIITFISLVVLAVFPFATSWVNSKVIDELVNLATTDNGSLEVLTKFIIFYTLLRVASSLISVLRQYVDMNMWFKVSLELTNVVTEKFSNLDVQHYEDPETRNLIQKVSENFGHRPQRFMDEVTGMVRPIVQIIASLAILVVFSPLIVVILVLTTIPEALINIIYGKRKWGIWDMKGEERRDYHWTRGHLINENSLVELRIFGIRHYFLEKVYKLFYDFQYEQIKIENKRLKTGYFIRLLSLFGYIFTFVRFGMSVVSRAITIGQFNFYLSSANRLQNSFEEIFNRVGRLYEHGLYVYDVYKFLELENEIIPGDIPLEEKEKPPLIEFKNVSFKYPDTDKYVIRDLNLKIKPGERIAIVGENGVGKTTLIRLLMRFYDISDGEILIDSMNIKDLDIETWYEKVGLLFQNFNTYHFAAKTNIQLGNIEKFGDMDSTIEAAKKSGANSFIEEYKNGYEQVLSKSFEGGIKPSHGQWQRIALARVFFKNAPVLMLDEPTSAIDPKAEFEIFERLFEFTEGKTVIIISHRFSTVKNAERIIVLDDGKILEDGSHEELMKMEDGKYKTAFNLQKKGYE